MNILARKLGIGTVQFGTDYGISNSFGQTTSNEVNEILSIAEANGVQYIDTAYAYGNAEEVLGCRDLNLFKIISKYIPNTLTVEEQFKTSLNRLNKRKIYGYLAHRPLSLIENDYRDWSILQELKDMGLIEKVGASFNSIDEIELIIDKGVVLDIIQVPYNYFDRRFETLMILLKSLGVEIHTRSAFLQGLFFCNPLELDPFFNDVKDLIIELQKYENLPNLLLNYVVNKGYIDVVNIGVNNSEQLYKNILGLKAGETKLPNLNMPIDSEILMPSRWPKGI